MSISPHELVSELLNNENGNIVNTIIIMLSQPDIKKDVSFNIQIGDYYKSIRTALQLARNRIEQNGYIVVIVEDAQRNIVVQQNKQGGLLSKLDKNSTQKAATQYVADVLNATDDECVQVVYGMGDKMVLSSYDDGDVVYVVGSTPNLKIVGYADKTLIEKHKDEDGVYRIGIGELLPIEDLILQHQYINPHSVKATEMMGIMWRVGMAIQYASLYYRVMKQFDTHKFYIVATKSMYNADITQANLDNALFFGIDKEHFEVILSSGI